MNNQAEIDRCLEIAILPKMNRFNKRLALSYHSLLRTNFINVATILTYIQQNASFDCHINDTAMENVRL